jgi:hypothetical protein
LQENKHKHWEKTKSWCEKGHRCKCATVNVSSKYQVRSTSIFFDWKAVITAGAGFIGLKIQHIMIFPVIFVAYQVNGWMEVQSVWVMAAYNHGYQSSKSLCTDLPAHRRLVVLFLTKKGLLMLFWIFIHEKVQLTCPYGYHLWPESSTDHSNLIVLVGSGLCLCKAKLGQHSDDLNLGRIFCDFWQLFSSSKGWSRRLIFSARPAGT